MANQPRLGFIPSGSNGRAQTRRYTVATATTYANSMVGLAPGEVVKIVADGTILPYQVGDFSSAPPANLPLGVVASVSYKDTTGIRQYGGYIPTGLTYTGDNSVLNPNAPVIEVWDDPGIEYLAALLVDSGTSLTEFQKNFSNMECTATSSTSVDTIFRRSLRSLSGTAATTGPFRVLEILRSPAQDYSATSYLRVKCMLNAAFNPFFQSTGV